MFFGRRVKLEGKYLDQQILKSNNDLKKREEYLKKSILKLEKSLDDIEVTFKEESAKKRQLKKDLTDLNKEYVELEKSYDDIRYSKRAKTKELNSVMTAISGHTLKFKHTESKCEAELERLEALKSQLTTIEKLKSTRIQECNNLEDSIEDLKKEELELKKSIKNQTTDNSHVVVNKKNKIESLNSEIKEVEKVLKELKVKSVVLDQNNKTIDKELQDKIDACDQAIAERESFVKGGTKEASKKLTTLNRNIEQKQRMLFEIENKIENAKINKDLYKYIGE